MKTINPGKQIKRMHNAPLHIKRKWISAHLDENLLLKYDKRAISVIKGDTVRVMRGNFHGHEDKVVKVNTKKNTIEIEGITMSKADGNKIAKPIHNSNVMITKLNLTDKWRREKLERGLSEETRKEIEKEAQKQLIEAEEEKKREEEQKKLEEQAKKDELKTKEEIIETHEKEDKKEEKPDVQKIISKKQTQTKPPTQKKKKAKKPSIKKTQKKEEKYMTKHMKRLNAPRVLKLHRKERIWTIRTSPGPHALKKSIPLGLIIRDYLKLTDTLKETKNVLSNREVTVDGKIVKNHKYTCGLMDVISIPTVKKNYRILFDKRGKLALVPIVTNNSKWKLCRIQNKTIVKGKQLQLNLHDGRNKIVKKDEYKTGDVLKIYFENQKIDDIYKFEKGTVSMIIGGSHIGEIANIGDIETTISSKTNLIQMKGSTEFTTLKKHVFPIGKNKPSIELPEVKIQ